ncbi:ABC transporter ATP-binding protein [Bacillus sp. SCS-151]|uniref:ABC transporter ATP-binding protein n=1 Tax=Nanhaiella sioensis TaxID=3115293 RepID=UPI00397CECF5
MEVSLQIEHLTKDIGNKRIIDDLTFEVYQGEVFGFLGPNGAGKTTTIRMLVGLMSITSGEVHIKGVNLKKNFEEALSHVGGIVENPEMYKYLSGYQNLVHYSRMIKGITKERIDEVVRLVGLENRIKNKVKTYSLGMRQRLGLAQALLHKPSLLILDEPTNGLDPAGIREVRDYLRKLAREEGLAVIVSSHLLSEMELMCDRIAIIQHGKLIGVQQVNEFVNEGEKLRVSFSVDSVDQAQATIDAEFPAITSHIQHDRVEVEIERESIPELVTSLVHKQVKIYEIEQKSKSLEDRFLEVTGGNVID